MTKISKKIENAGLRYPWIYYESELTDNQQPETKIHEPKMLYHTGVGHYLRFSLHRPQNQDRYLLYLAIKVWKRDGCNETKLCNPQIVASFGGNLGLIDALSEAEKWIKTFIRDEFLYSKISTDEFLDVTL